MEIEFFIQQQTIEFLLRKESSNSLAMATIGKGETVADAHSDANYTPTFVLSGDKHVFVRDQPKGCRSPGLSCEFR